MVYLEALLSSDFISYFSHLTFDIVNLNFSSKNYDYVSVNDLINGNDSTFIEISSILILKKNNIYYIYFNKIKDKIQYKIQDLLSMRNPELLADIIYNNIDELTEMLNYINSVDRFTLIQTEKIKIKKDLKKM